jgi:hypothetical protein
MGKNDIQTWTLSGPELAYMKLRAERGDDFMQRTLDGYQEHGSVTDKQKKRIEANLKEYNDRARLGGVKVANRFFRDKKPVCAFPVGKCKEIATEPVVMVKNGVTDDWGMCAPHKVEYAAEHPQPELSKAG